MATEVAQSNDGAESIAIPPREVKTTSAGPEISVNAPGGMKVIRRNGKVTTFDANKIAVAMTKAFLAVEGGNAAASNLAGVNARLITFVAYVICGLMAGWAGVILTADTHTSDPVSVALYIELDAILAVVIGGGSLAGGRIFLGMTVIGALVAELGVVPPFVVDSRRKPESVRVALDPGVFVGHR